MTFWTLWESLVVYLSCSLTTHIMHIVHIITSHKIITCQQFQNAFQTCPICCMGWQVYLYIIPLSEQTSEVVFSSRQIQCMVNETFFNCMQGLVWYSLAFLLQGAWKMILSCSVQWNPHRFHKDWSERLVDVWEHWHDICSCRLLCVTVVHVCKEQFHLNMHDSGGTHTYLFLGTLISLLSLYVICNSSKQAGKQATNLQPIPTVGFKDIGVK